MNIAVTATEASLEANVDPRFGRCPYFLIVDTDTMEYQAVENPNVALGGGAGIQSAQLIAQQGVQFVLTGNCGPNAHQTLSAAGVGVIIGCNGMISDVVEQFKAGQLHTADQPNVDSKFGVGGGRGMGGGGRGMGRGMDGVQAEASISRGDELNLLRQQADAMTQQMQQLQQRIRQLEQKGS